MKKKIRFKLGDSNHQKRAFEAYSNVKICIDSEDLSKINFEQDIIVAKVNWKKDSINEFKIVYSGQPRIFKAVEYCKAYKEIRIHCINDSTLENSKYGSFKIDDIEIVKIDKIQINIYDYDSLSATIETGCVHPFLPPTKKGNIIVGGPGFLD